MKKQIPENYHQTGFIFHEKSSKKILISRHNQLTHAYNVYQKIINIETFEVSDDDIGDCPININY